MLYPRNLKSSLLQASKDTPVILLNGARQTGKSTLMTGLFPADQAPQYVSFDDLLTLSAARQDPKGFVENLPERVIIDEIQRAPELMLPIKHSVDRNRKPGRFFLTGSANVLALPRVADTLVGRIGIHTLWPLSQGELRGVQESFVDRIFENEKLKAGKSFSHAQLAEMMYLGGFPDILQRDSQTRQRHWFTGYISTLIERDVRDLRNIEHLVVMPKLLKLLATRSGSLLNYSDLARSLELKLTTLKTYVYLLQLLFVVLPIQPWFGNKGKRLLKSPKLHMVDTAFLCHLLQCDAKGLANDGQLLGLVFENFVMMELIKQVSWSDTQPDLYHFRTEQMEEVDIVLEAPDGRIVGIECKCASTMSSDSFKGLKALKELAGKKFKRGIVLYPGDQIVSFGEDFQAVPVSALWETTSGASPSLSIT
jgi:predicted AAA+ superfamily ATPase